MNQQEGWEYLVRLFGATETTPWRGTPGPCAHIPPPAGRPMAVEGEYTRQCARSVVADPNSRWHREFMDVTGQLLDGQGPVEARGLWDRIQSFVAMRTAGSADQGPTAAQPYTEAHLGWVNDMLSPELGLIEQRKLLASARPELLLPMPTDRYKTYKEPKMPAASLIQPGPVDHSREPLMLGVRPTPEATTLPVTGAVPLPADMFTVSPMGFKVLKPEYLGAVSVTLQPFLVQTASSTARGSALYVVDTAMPPDLPVGQPPTSAFQVVNSAAAAGLGVLVTVGITDQYGPTKMLLVGHSAQEVAEESAAAEVGIQAMPKQTTPFDMAPFVLVEPATGWSDEVGPPTPVKAIEQAKISLYAAWPILAIGGGAAALYLGYRYLKKKKR